MEEEGGNDEIDEGKEIIEEGEDSEGKENQ
jgi:hypothetical protein